MTRNRGWRGTDIPARDTASALRAEFDAWPEADYISMPERIDEVAEVVFDFSAPGAQPSRVRMKHSGEVNYRSNLRSIYLTIKDLRMIWARGHGDLMTSTVSQMLALGAGAHQRDPYEVLGLRPDAPIDVVLASGKALQKRYHPDNADGGNAELFKEVTEALDSLKTAV